MVYRRYNRGYRRRRRYRRRNPYRKPRRYQVADTAYKAYKLASKLARAVNVEYKHHQSTFTGTGIDYSGYVTPINVIPQGDTDISRDGDSLKCQNLTGRFGIRYGGNNATVRFLIVWDQDVKLTAASEYFEVTGSSAAPHSPKDYDKRFRYKTLFDRTVHVDVSNPTKLINFSIPIGKHTQFNNGTTTVNTGALQLLAISDVVGVNVPLMDGVYRLTFTDN